MMRRRHILTAGLAAAMWPSASPSDATAADALHEYTAYEKLVLNNVSQFHINFNNRQFDKNGDLVADNVHVTSNGTALQGRAAFVQQTGRFAGPFPDVKIDDLVTIVDGNRAAVLFVITGTHEGDLQTPEGVFHATHRRIKVDGAEFFVFDANGRLVDLVTIERLDQLFQQIKGSQ